MNQGSRPVQRVLIVDDEPSVIATYRKGLGTPANTERAAALAALETSLFDQDQTVSERAVEFDLVACSQGAEAIDAVQRACQQEQPFAVIFLDITMPPGIDGIETATRIRALDNNVNIVLVTGNRLASPTSLIARIPLTACFFSKNRSIPLNCASWDWHCVASGRPKSPLRRPMPISKHAWSNVLKP